MKRPSNNISPEEFPKAFNIALRYLNIRIRSVKELKDYLLRKKFTPEVIDAVIQRLVGLKFLNDEAFGESFIRGKQHKGKSKLIIRHELKQKGIDESLIHELTQSAKDDQEIAKEFIEKKKRIYGHLTEKEFREKMMRVLSSRGFSWETIRKALKEE
ncbi:MAG: regulatory protein RecX [Candidatus Levyibacteriota bacterium]